MRGDRAHTKPQAEADMSPWLLLAPAAVDTAKVHALIFTAVVALTCSRG